MLIQFWSLGAADVGSEPSERHRTWVTIKTNEGWKVRRLKLRFNEMIKSFC